MRTAANFQARALAYIIRHGFCTAPQLAKVTGFPINATRKHLNELCAKGLTHRAEKANIHSAVMAVRPGPMAEVQRAPAAAHISDPCALPREFFLRGVSL